MSTLFPLSIPIAISLLNYCFANTSYISPPLLAIDSHILVVYFFLSLFACRYYRTHHLHLAQTLLAHETRLFRYCRLALINRINCNERRTALTQPTRVTSSANLLFSLYRRARSDQPRHARNAQARASTTIFSIYSLLCLPPPPLTRSIYDF